MATVAWLVSASTRRDAAGAALVLALVAVIAFIAAAPARATVIDRERYAGVISADYELCGIRVHEEGEFGGTVHVRVGKGDVTGAFFAHDRFHYAVTITNEANGRYFTTEGAGVFNEQRATRIDGSVFEFTQIEAGQTFVLRDPDGNVVLRDRGRVRTTILFDTLGDGTPGGELVAVLDEDVAGPHPGFRFDDTGVFCDRVQQLLG